MLHCSNIYKRINAFQGFRVLLDKYSLENDSKRVIFSYNITKLHDGFVTSFNITFLGKIPEFYVKSSFKFFKKIIIVSFQIHIKIMDLSKENDQRLLLERSLLVCQLEKKSRVRDHVYNYIKRVMNLRTNFTNECPIHPGFYTFSNYVFNTSEIPVLFQILDSRVTFNINYCSGKKWQIRNQSCFLNAFIQLITVL